MEAAALEDAFPSKQNQQKWKCKSMFFLTETDTEQLD